MTSYFHTLDFESEVIFKVGVANLASRNFMGSCDFTDSSRCVCGGVLGVGVAGSCPPLCGLQWAKKRESGEWGERKIMGDKKPVICIFMKNKKNHSYYFNYSFSVLQNPFEFELSVDIWMSQGSWSKRKGAVDVKLIACRQLMWWWWDARVHRPTWLCKDK